MLCALRGHYFHLNVFYPPLQPIGNFSILEEQCVFLKPTDATFKAGLYENHLGKSSSFLKPEGGKELAKAHWCTMSALQVLPKRLLAGKYTNGSKHVYVME